MYLRFVSTGKDRDSRHKQGLLTIAYDMRDEFELDQYELETVIRIIKWFKDNLKSPAILKRKDSNRCISWFKPDAKEPIDMMWELFYLLQSKGLSVEVLKRNEIGEIKYEDVWQVIAQPHRHNRKVKA